MLLKTLLQYSAAIFAVLYGSWALFDVFSWWTHLSVVATLAVVSWTLGYALFDRLNREVVTQPEKKAVLVTGCDTGFGHDLAVKLDRFGFNVFAGVLNPSGEGALKLTSTCSNRLRILKMDVTKEVEVEAAAKTILDSGLPLWAVVNNAGIGSSGFLDWGRDVDELKKVFEVNVFGLVRVAKNALPLLRETACSRLVNVASLAGRVSAPNIGPYSMSKHSVRSFSDSLRRELQVTRDRVHVVVIEPTFYRTAIIDAVNGSQARERLWADTPDAIKVTYPEHLLEKMKRAQAQVDRSARGNIGEVVETLMDAVTLLQPKPFYRCCGYLDLAIWALASGPEIFVDLALRLRAAGRRRR